MNIKILSVKELEKMNIEDRRKYYITLRKYVNSLKHNYNATKISKKLISYIAPFIRNYDLDIVGEENIINYPGAVFICNHSNSHDFFTLHEIFNDLNRNVTPFGADDCLNFISLEMFKAGDVTLINRDDKESSINGMLKFSKKIIDGKDGIIFGEGTWNLHPIKPMQQIRTGGIQTAMISNTVVIPTIFEYVEVPCEVNKESELYTRCIVSFDKPIMIKENDNIIKKTIEVQLKMEEMRLNLWKKLGIKKDSFDDVNKDIYLNHTYLKKFGALGFEYDSNHEFKYLSKNEKGVVDNEYIIDKNGDFVPGITNKHK